MTLRNFAVRPVVCADGISRALRPRTGRAVTPRPFSPSLSARRSL
ncbi:hypothetical protein AB0942_25915 [Streptomyces nodosus]